MSGSATGSSGAAAAPVRMPTSLFQARNAKPHGRGMACRQKASFRTSRGTCHVLLLPAGKNTMSPGPSRRTWSFSSVTKTSPEMMCRVSSTL